jgi:molybdopterin-guanine dinucleotide biosynthesis protein A
VVAWDMPFVPQALLAELRSRGEDADVVAPESSGSRRGLEPLCAFYSPACIAPIERALDADDRRVIGFFDQVRVARIPAEDVRRYGDPERLFMNVNTPDELALAERHASTADRDDYRNQEAGQDHAHRAPRR